MVCDALFTDFDNDDQTDLILAGEWMPVTFLKNENGKFKNVTAESGIGNKRVVEFNCCRRFQAYWQN